jgi:hypothetical protein
MEGKKYKTVVSSSHIDSHGDQMSKEALEQLRDFINADKKLRFGVDHNREFPPKGRVANAELIENNGFYYVHAEYHEYDNVEDVSWDSTLKIESFIEAAPFNEVEKEIPKLTKVSVDRNNFKNHQDYEKYLDSIKDIEFEFETGIHIRKAAMPDPELVITFGVGSILYQLVKPLVTKIGEKIADEIVDGSIAKGKILMRFLTKAIKNAAYYYTPKDRPLFIVFELPGTPHVELIAKTRDHDFVLKSLQKRKLEDVKDQISDFTKRIDVDKIQFKLSDKGKWKFTYLLTKQGASVGKKESIKKRDKRYERIKEINKSR